MVLFEYFFSKRFLTLERNSVNVYTFKCSLVLFIRKALINRKSAKMQFSPQFFIQPAFAHFVYVLPKNCVNQWLEV